MSSVAQHAENVNRISNDSSKLLSVSLLLSFPPATTHQAFLLVVIAMYPTASHAQLAAMTRMPERRVRTELRALVGQGRLCWQRTGRANRYTVLLGGAVPIETSEPIGDSEPIAPPPVMNSQVVLAKTTPTDNGFKERDKSYNSQSVKSPTPRRTCKPTDRPLETEDELRVRK